MCAVGDRSTQVRPRGDKNSFGLVLHHLSKHAGVDVIEIAEDAYMFRRPCMRSDQRGVSLQGRFIIFNAGAAALVEIGDINVVLFFCMRP